VRPHDPILDWMSVAEVVGWRDLVAGPLPRVLPMQLQRGDRFRDEAVEWKVIGSPFTTAARTNAHVQVRSVNPPGLTDLRTWGAHERARRRHRHQTPGGVSAKDEHAAREERFVMPDHRADTGMK
jgi:hypothetical protein